MKKPVINTGIVLIQIWAEHLPFTTFIMCRSWKKYSFPGTEAKFSTVPSRVSCTKAFISFQLPKFPTKFQGAFQLPFQLPTFFHPWKMGIRNNVLLLHIRLYHWSECKLTLEQWFPKGALLPPGGFFPTHGGD